MVKGVTLFSGFHGDHPYISANLKPLPSYMKNSNAVVYRNTVYISGGVNTAEVWAYKNGQNGQIDWIKIGHMNRKRGAHLMEVMDDQIVACSRVVK